MMIPAHITRRFLALCLIASADAVKELEKMIRAEPMLKAYAMPNGMTGLMIAAQADRLAVVELLAKKSDPRVANNAGLSALDLAGPRCKGLIEARAKALSEKESKAA